MSIHPTAIVDPAAQLDPEVEIGPFSIVEADVRIGAGTRIAAHARIHSGTTIGAENEIFHGAVLGGLPQHLSFDPAVRTELIIGNNNTLREYVNIHRSSQADAPTRIGDRNYIMGSFHIGHDCVIGNDNVLTQSSIIAGHATLGDHIFVSGNVGIHQFCRVGDFAIVGGCSKVVEDIPPFAMADGVPAMVTGLNSVGMRRNGIDKDRYRAIKNAYKVIYRSGRSASVAVDELANTELSPDVRLLIDFFKSSERGVMGYTRVEEGLDL